MSSVDDIIADAMNKSSASGAADAGKARSRQSRKTSAAPEADAPERRLTPTMQRLREGILDVYTAAQMAAFLLDPFAAQCIQNSKESCADAWIELAERDAKVKAFLTKLTTGSAWGNVIMAHATLALPILAKRGVIPGGALFGGAPFNATEPARSAEPPSDADVAAAAKVAEDLARQGYVPANGVPA